MNPGISSWFLPIENCTWALNMFEIDHQISWWVLVIGNKVIGQILAECWETKPIFCSFLFIWFMPFVMMRSIIKDRFLKKVHKTRRRDLHWFMKTCNFNWVLLSLMGVKRSQRQSTKIQLDRIPWVLPRWTLQERSRWVNFSPGEQSTVNKDGIYPSTKVVFSSYHQILDNISTFLVSLNKLC